MCLGFYCAIQSMYVYSTLITLALSFAFCTYFIVNLPFVDAYQNYRSALINFAFLFTLFTANYYRTMKSNAPI